MAAVVEVTQVLLNAQSPDANVRTQAEEQLKAFQEQNFPGYIASLSAELANNAKPADSRRLAGLVLKNLLDAKEEARKRELHQRWQSLDPTLKQHVRDALVSTLHCESVDVRHTAAMVTAKIAAIDLPRKEWPTLIQSLLHNMGAQPAVTGVRQATLEAMGYVCEEMASLKEEVLSAQEINMILTAVVAGMGATEPNESRLAATVALHNAIEFAQHNFENETERNYLMQVVCQGTQSPEIRIRTASFECLHEIAALYYNKLPSYMTELYRITVHAIKEDQEEVALQAIEFWSTLADTEYELMMDGTPQEQLNFIKQAAPHLVPMLLSLLTKQEEGQEQDETTWNISMAAGTCLGLVARVVQNDVVPLVMPFVEANISKNSVPEDWRCREAATFAFGQIMEGPFPDVLLPISNQALSFLLIALKDPHPHVKDTTAWTIGRILEFTHSQDIEPRIITRETLPPIISVLLESLKDEAHIVYRVCCAISSLARGFQGAAGGTSPMSPYFKDVIAALLQTAQRFAHYGEDTKVQISAFEAINDLVRNATRDTLDIVAQLIQVILPEIQKTFELSAASGEAREKQAEVQGQLCGVLQVIVKKLSEEEDTKAAVLPYADQIMETLLRIFSHRSATVHEEAMLAVGAFTYALGKQFNKYLPQFYPYLKTGLSNYLEWQVCLSTVGVLGDVCRNVEDLILPYCDDIMSLLIQNLGREDVHRTIKPQILAAFGDIALVIGDKFEKYLDAVLRVLKQAMQLSIHSAQQGDAEFADYNNELRHGILDAYSGIIQGTGPPKCTQYLSNEVPAIIEFVSSIGNEEEPDEEVAKAAVNLLGDVCSVMQGAGQMLRAATHKEWETLVTFCQEQCEEECEWAIQQIQHSMQR